ncbi:MAG: hypothetical protein K8M05_01815 [Deltaproteobacteria bacterium]|nr:hypothetical protein [Kofleriaceae bacterium]
MITERKSNTGRTVAVVGGGALLLLLLFRGKGWGLGGSGGGTGAGGDELRSPCRVRIDADGLELDGQRADLPTTIERCKAAGRADVTATGAAIVGVIARTVQALKDAGVDVYADPSVWDTVGYASSRAR